MAKKQSTKVAYLGSHSKLNFKKPTQLIALILFLTPFIWLFFEDPATRFGRFIGQNDLSLSELENIGRMVCFAFITIASFLFVFDYAPFRKGKGIFGGILFGIVLSFACCLLFQIASFVMHSIR